MGFFGCYDRRLKFNPCVRFNKVNFRSLFLTCWPLMVSVLWFDNGFGMVPDKVCKHRVQERSGTRTHVRQAGLHVQHTWPKTLAIEPEQKV